MIVICFFLIFSVLLVLVFLFSSLRLRSFNKIFFEWVLSIFKEISVSFKFLIINIYIIIVFLFVNYYSFIYLGLGLRIKYGVVLIFSLTIVVSIWILWFSVGWVYFISHLLPRGVSGILIFFIPLIEFLGVIIRPLTLAIRLATNISCGHVVLLIFGYFSLNLKFYMWLIVSVLLIGLFLIELLVCLIQAYVFWSLLCIYSIEIESV